MGKKTVVFDFDGVIHSYTSGWQGIGNIPDPVVPGIQSAISTLRMEGYEVIVVSTRCAKEEGARAVQNYLKNNHIKVDAIMAEKPPAICYIDDRAICFDGHAEHLIKKIRNFVPWNKETDPAIADMERKYVIVCNEHSGNWPGVLLFWGHRTQDNESRSFGGYTSDIDSCELYSEYEVREKGYRFPKYHDGMTLEGFRKHDDILIEPENLEKLGYKQMKVWYIP